MIDGLFILTELFGFEAIHKIELISNWYRKYPIVCLSQSELSVAYVKRYPNRL